MAPSTYVFKVFTFLNTVVPPRRKDIVSELPPEIGCHILRLLDVDSLINGILVSPAWRNLGLHDPVLSRRIRCYLYERKHYKKENRKVDSRYRTIRSIYLNFFKNKNSMCCPKRKQPEERRVEPPAKKRAMRF